MEQPRISINEFIHRPRSLWQKIILAIVATGFAGVVAMALLVLALTPGLPSIDNMAEDRLKVPMRVFTSDGVLIGEFGEERRLPIKIEETPKPLIDAILAAEDDGFYDHHGVDFTGIARAAWINFQSGGHTQGASTITMQVARNFFLSPEKTYTRKLREILLAFKLERNLTKDEILELYLNKIYLGQRAYGFGAASMIYYGRHLPELTLPEVSMLAGLPKAPSRNNPLSKRENAKENAINRRNYILGRMFKLNFVDEAVFRQATLAPLSARKHKLKYDVEAPYISEMVRQYMLQKYENKTYAGGFNVYTTIDSKNQTAANESLRNGLLAYDQRHGYRGPLGHSKIKLDTDKDKLDEVLVDYRAIGNLMPAIVMLVENRSITAYTQEGFVAEIGWEGLSWARRYIDANNIGSTPKSASDILRVGNIIYLHSQTEGIWRLAQMPNVAGALVSLRPNDGAILALTGGFDFYSSKFNRATQAERQPGSNLKPFIYSAALEKGFTAATTVSGAPIAIEDETLEDVWRPENYSGKFFGPTRLRKALQLSLNLVSIRVLRAIGPTYAADYLSRFGFDKEKLPRNLSMALGSASVTPMTMATAFSVFANGGFKIEPYFITRVEDGENNLLEQANPSIVCKTCPETRLTMTEKALQGEPHPADTTPITVSEVTTTTDNTAEDAAPIVQEPRYAPRVIPLENVFIMTTIMRDVVKHGTGRRAMELGRRDLAGKTGTTNEFKDAWFSGFNDSVVTTTWIGFDQPTTLGRGEAGASAALPTWVEFMRVALDGVPEHALQQPKTVVQRYIHEESGELAHEDDMDAIPEYFATNTTGEGPDAMLLGDPNNPGSGEAGGNQQNPTDKLPEGLF